MNGASDAHLEHQTLCLQAVEHQQSPIQACRRLLAIACVLAISLPALANASTCYGSPGNGRIADSVQLPAKGANLAAYNQLGVQLGRTYVHASVHQIVIDAYTAAGKTMPDRLYVYGETGFEHGGEFRPHRTHQSGLSVDFMVPVLDDANRSVALPSNPLNKFGYGLEFDAQGRIPGYRIDFDAMGEHLMQLSSAARRHDIAIERVIFDPRLMEKLFATRHGADLKRLPFMKTTPWIRHDEHYHVDFKIACRPLSEYRGK